MPSSFRNLVVTFAVVALGCSSNEATLGGRGPGDTGAGGGATSGSGGGSTSSTGGGATGGGDEDPRADAGNCGVERFNPQRLPPDLLIVLDESGSMDDPFGSGGSKWAQVTSVLKQTVASSQADIKWGLTLFPPGGDTSCSAAQVIDVPVALNTSASITHVIDSKGPGGGTPTHLAIQAAAAHLQSLAGDNPKFMLLATDGAPSCPYAADLACTCSNGTASTSGIAGQQCCDTGACLPCWISDAAAGTVEEIRKAADLGIHTFVIGIASEPDEYAGLNRMAIAGREPRAGTDKFYPVANQAELATAINAISKGALSCTLTLSKQPPDPTHVGVSLGGQKVPRDATHADGWDFAGGTNTAIQFYGSYCDQLKAGSASDVEVVFACSAIN